MGKLEESWSEWEYWEYIWIASDKSDPDKTLPCFAYAR